MNKLTYSLTLFYVLLQFIASAQTSVPLVPEQVQFADMAVRFDDDARRIVQQDVNALVANRQYWTAKLDRVALYFPMIDGILMNEGVPADFKYLAVQESSLTPDAVSSSAAVGYWQFKRESAQNQGMRVDDEIDERKSITASTRGAAAYLKKSNAQYNNWVASLYSYYLGASGVAKLIPPDWAYAREISLDSHTDRYILRFFAHKIAIESALKFHQASNRFALIEYPNGGGKTFKAIAEELAVDEFELRKYNRWVLGETVPTDRAYVMAVPVPNDQINDVRQKVVNVSGRKTPDFVQTDVGFPVLRRVTTASAAKNTPALYEINGLPGIQAQAGDNAASLARKAKISLSSFLRYNDMGDRDPILTNDVYYLAKKRKKALVPFHTVRDGETARSISQRYGIRLKKLMRYNRLDRVQKLASGRVMWLRERRPGNKPVEIINAPTAPVYDKTPTPAERPIAQGDPDDSSSGVMQPARSVAGMGNVPRNASERKLYQPKLATGGITPSDGTAPPAAAPRTDDPAPALTPQPTTTARTSPPAPTTASRSTSADGTQRIVIVRTPETTQPTPSTDRPDGWSASSRSTTSATPDPTDAPVSKPVRSSGTYADARASKPARPVSSARDSGYEGPREQQADGSLTAPTDAPLSRPTTPTAPRSESRLIVKTTPTTEPALSGTGRRTEPAMVTPAPSRPATTVATSTVDRTASTHTVEPGQTYYSISRLYGLTVDELLTLNNRTTNDLLAAGQTLKVKAPSESTTPAPARTAMSSPSASETTYHTVAKGETMFRISKQYGVTIEQIQGWNNLTDAGVKEGQKIKIVK